MRKCHYFTSIFLTSNVEYLPVKMDLKVDFYILEMRRITNKWFHVDYQLLMAAADFNGVEKYFIVQKLFQMFFFITVTEVGGHRQRAVIVTRLLSISTFSPALSSLAPAPITPIPRTRVSSGQLRLSNIKCTKLSQTTDS